MSMDLKKFAQPWINTMEEIHQFLCDLGPSSVATGSQIDDAASDINTRYKKAGKMVWDSTLGRPTWADGPDPGDTWSDSAGSVTNTPSA